MSFPDTSIRVALFNGASAISRAIKWFTWGPYSHAAWWHGFRGEVTEAWKGGVRQCRVWESHTPGTQIDLFIVDRATHDQLMDAESFIVDQLGKPYDYMSVMRFVSRRSTASRWQTSWFCSELIFAGCAHAKVDLLARVPPSKVSPSLLSLSPLLIYDRSLVTHKGGVEPL